MPILQVHLLAGRPEETKAALVEQLTETVHRVLGSDPERVQILISEYGEGQWSKAGQPLKLSGGVVS